MPDWCPNCRAMLSPGLETCPVCGTRLKPPVRRRTTRPGDEISGRDIISLSLYMVAIAFIPIILVTVIGLICVLIFQ